MNSTLTIRHATASDSDAIERLAALDSSSAPPGEVLLAEVGDELWAAVEVDSGIAIADPFRSSGDLVELLRLHANGTSGRRFRPARRLIPRLV